MGLFHYLRQRTFTHVDILKRKRTGSARCRPVPRVNALIELVYSNESIHTVCGDARHRKSPHAQIELVPISASSRQHEGAFRQRAVPNGIARIYAVRCVALSERPSSLRTCVH